MDPSDVLEHLLKSAEWTASRSSGPGGQHRDKASTRAELSITVDALSGLEPEVVSKLATVFALKEHPLRIVVQDERSLARNQELAVERLKDLVSKALAPPSPPRRPTRPTRASRQRRIAAKVRHGRNKLLRQPPEENT